MFGLALPRRVGRSTRRSVLRTAVLCLPNSEVSKTRTNYLLIGLRIHIVEPDRTERHYMLCLSERMVTMEKKVPVEVSGYRDQLRYVVDIYNGIAEFRMMSVPNDNHSDEDFSPWEGNSETDDCPF